MPQKKSASKTALYIFKLLSVFVIMKEKTQDNMIKTQDGSDQGMKEIRALCEIFFICEKYPPKNG